MASFLAALGFLSWFFGGESPERSSDTIETRRAEAPSGQRTKIAFIPFVYPNCKSYGDVKFGLLVKPDHGLLFLEQDEELFDHPFRRSDCFEKPPRGLRVEYLSQSGYKGDDRAMYLIDNQKAETWTFYQAIEVQ